MERKLLVRADCRGGLEANKGKARREQRRKNGLLDSYRTLLRCLLFNKMVGLTANSNTMGPYSTHMDAEFDAGFIVK